MIFAVIFALIVAAVSALASNDTTECKTCNSIQIAANPELCQEIANGQDLTGGACGESRMDQSMVSDEDSCKTTVLRCSPATPGAQARWYYANWKSFLSEPSTEESIIYTTCEGYELNEFPAWYFKKMIKAEGETKPRFALAKMAADLEVVCISYTGGPTTSDITTPTPEVVED